MIGDSTMSNKVDPEVNPEHGWGQVLPELFDSNVIIHNHAVNGRSTKSFIEEGRWSGVLNLLQKGDYLIIQFGHNDEKSRDPTRYTDPEASYQYNLERFVSEARDKGAKPIICSSIVRRKFNTKGQLVDTHGLYPESAREVSQRLEVPFVDLNKRSHDLVLSMGAEQSRELYLWFEPGEVDYYPDGKQDDTHLSRTGAQKIAMLAIDEMCAYEMEFCDHFIPIVASPH